jgi:outer membrane protein TolC
MPDARLTAGPGQGILAVHPADPAPNLPPAAIVEQVLRTNPGIKAVDSQIPVAKANRSQLEAGDYEWTLLLGGQQRRVSPDIGPSDRFQEWNGDLQRQVRLPARLSLTPNWVIWVSIRRRQGETIPSTKPNAIF